MTNTTDNDDVPGGVNNNANHADGEEDGGSTRGHAAVESLVMLSEGGASVANNAQTYGAAPPDYMPPPPAVAPQLPPTQNFQSHYPQPQQQQQSPMAPPPLYESQMSNMVYANILQQHPQQQQHLAMGQPQQNDSRLQNMAHSNFLQHHQPHPLQIDPRLQHHSFINMSQQQPIYQNQQQAFISQQPLENYQQAPAMHANIQGQQQLVNIQGQLQDDEYPPPAVRGNTQPTDERALELLGDLAHLDDDTASALDSTLANDWEGDVDNKRKSKIKSVAKLKSDGEPTPTEVRTLKRTEEKQTRMKNFKMLVGTIPFVEGNTNFAVHLNVIHQNDPFHHIGLIDPATSHFYDFFTRELIECRSCNDPNTKQKIIKLGDALPVIVAHFSNHINIKEATNCNRQSQKDCFKAHFEFCDLHKFIERLKIRCDWPKLCLRLREGNINCLLMSYSPTPDFPEFMTIAYSFGIRCYLPQSALSFSIYKLPRDMAVAAFKLPQKMLILENGTNTTADILEALNNDESFRPGKVINAQHHTNSHTFAAEFACLSDEFTDHIIVKGSGGGCCQQVASFHFSGDKWVPCPVLDQPSSENIADKTWGGNLFSVENKIPRSMLETEYRSAWKLTKPYNSIRYDMRHVTTKSTSQPYGVGQFSIDTFTGQMDDIKRFIMQINIQAEPTEFLNKNPTPKDAFVMRYDIFKVSIGPDQKTNWNRDAHAVAYDAWNIEAKIDRPPSKKKKSKTKSIDRDHVYVLNEIGFWPVQSEMLSLYHDERDTIISYADALNNWFEKFYQVTMNNDGIWPY